MSINELILANPITSIIVISILVTVVMTAIRYFVTDRELMRDIKKKQKFIREEMKKYRDNVEKLNELNQQMMEQFPAQMKQTFKIMLITFVPLLILFAWLRSTFALTVIAKSWIWWYIGISLVVSIVLGKVLKLD
jgi:uncharacterized membrane protein (DUF106 family)